MRGISIGSDSTHVNNAGDWFVSRFRQPVGAALLWHRHALECPTDSRGIERFGCFDVARIEFIPGESSKRHSFLLYAIAVVVEMSSKSHRPLSKRRNYALRKLSGHRTNLSHATLRRK